MNGDPIHYAQVPWKCEHPLGFTVLRMTVMCCPAWGPPRPPGGLRGKLEKLIADWREEADFDEKYMPRAHASEIHDVEATIRLNRMHANTLEELL